LTLSDSRIRALQPTQKIKDWAHWSEWKAQLKELGLTSDEESDLDYSLLEALLFQTAGIAATDMQLSGCWRKRSDTLWYRASLGGSTCGTAEMDRTGPQSPPMVSRTRTTTACVRTLQSTPWGLFVGTANPFGPEIAVRNGATRSERETY